MWFSEDFYTWFHDVVFMCGLMRYFFTCGLEM